MHFVKLGLILSLALSTNAQAIVGGHASGPHSPIAPSTVFLDFKAKKGDQGGWSCTGSIISKNTILTASHCVHKAAYATVVFSTQFDFGQKLNPNYSRPATKIVINHLYDRDKLAQGVAKDTAMVRFQGDLPYGYRPIQVLEYKKSLEYIKIGAEVHVAGFGNTTNQAVDESTIKTLREVKTTFIGLNPRAKFELMFESGSCQGDSGGPAYMMISGVPYLIGVASWAVVGCLSNTGYSAFFRNQL